MQSRTIQWSNSDEDQVCIRRPRRAEPGGGAGCCVRVAAADSRAGVGYFGTDRPVQRTRCVLCCGSALDRATTGQRVDRRCGFQEFAAGLALGLALFTTLMLL